MDLARSLIEPGRTETDMNLRNVDWWKKVILAVAPGVLFGALGLHFAATLAYLIPASPLKARIVAPVKRYMEPLFVQHWELFAPEPVVDTRLFLVSCRLTGPDGQKETPWSDITTPVRENEYRYHRLTPAERFERLHQG